jgi:CBS domain-containing protein
VSDALAIVVPFVVLLALIMYLRKRGKEFEIRTPELVLAALPVALWLVASGRIASLSVGDLSITALQHAAAAPATDDAHPLDDALPVETMRADVKGSITHIPDLKAEHTQALRFRLGAHGYDAWAVGQYLEQLTAGPDLRWLVLEDGDGRFRGLAAARDTQDAVRAGRLSLDDFVDHLNQGSPDDEAWLAGALPGWVGAAQALPADATRQAALARFGQSDADALPALDKDGRLRGIVRRDALVTGLLADVTARLQGG